MIRVLIGAFLPFAGACMVFGGYGEYYTMIGILCIIVCPFVLVSGVTAEEKRERRTREDQWRIYDDE